MYRRLFHNIREKTGSVQVTRDGVYEANVDKLKMCESSITELVRCSHKMIAAAQSHIASNGAVCGVLIRGLNYETDILLENEKVQDSYFEDTKV
jgi:hypothetical protein